MPRRMATGTEKEKLKTAVTIRNGESRSRISKDVCVCFVVELMALC